KGISREVMHSGAHRLSRTCRAPVDNFRRRPVQALRALSSAAARRPGGAPRGRRALTSAASRALSAFPAAPERYVARLPDGGPATSRARTLHWAAPTTPNAKFRGKKRESAA